MHRASAKVILLAVLLLIPPLSSVHAQNATDEASGSSYGTIEEATADDGLYAVLQTDLGAIVCKLYFQRAPLTVANFVGLAEGTRKLVNRQTGETTQKPFYDGVIFHRVVGGFLIQTGDPTGTGTGGPGYRFRDEIVPGLRFDHPGILAMANQGPNTNGSQFFITEKREPELDRRFSIFGRVVLGMDVVSAISSVPTEKEKPTEDVHLRSVKFIRRGKAAQNFDAEATFQELKDLNASQLTRLHTQRFHERVDPLREKSREQRDGSRTITSKKGEGKRPQQGQSIVVNYACYLPDGKVVESTYQEGQPEVLKAGEPRRGLQWEMNFLQMRVGEERWVFLPARLGFGARGIPGVVPANSPLILRLELVAIQKVPAASEAAAR
ncbi:MAG TPA: peptidylprolyl isomerase [Candidatus Krumholzibacteria bacterium]|nr:peptidylprolyl isomerase [Candidatus Krumholzibacteria bacterium]